MRMWVPTITLLAACNGAAGTCDASGLAAGAAEAVIDGEPWSATGVTWTETSGIQVNVPPDGSWWLTLVLQQGAVIESGDGPTFDLATDGGFLTVYPPEGPSYRSEAGTVTLAESVGDEVAGCFDVEASGQDGEIAVRGGRFHATPAE